MLKSLESPIKSLQLLDILQGSHVTQKGLQIEFYIRFSFYFGKSLDRMVRN